MISAATRCQSKDSINGDQSNYALLGVRCFYVSDVARDWFTARMDCIQKGGDLAKIDSADIHEILTVTYPSESRWIGFTRTRLNWISGEYYLCLINVLLYYCDYFCCLDRHIYRYIPLSFEHVCKYLLLQYNAMQCNAMQCNAMQCNAMQCNAMQCNAMQCNAMQCNAMQCNTQYAIRNTQYAIRNTQYAIRNTQYAIRNTQYAIRNTI